MPEPQRLTRELLERSLGTSASHSEDSRDDAIRTDCDICGGTGWLSRYGDAVPCSCLWEADRKRRERAMWPLVQLPPHPGFESMTFDTWKYTVQDVPVKVLVDASNAAQALAEGTWEKPLLLFQGRPGTGKTHLSVAAVKLAQKLGSPAKFAYVSHLVSELRALNRPEAERTPEEWQRLYQSFPLLALDDLGVQRSTPFADEELDHLIDARYIQGLPTIITTNLSRYLLPVRISDRLLDDGRSQRFHFDVVSYRSGERW